MIIWRITEVCSLKLLIPLESTALLLRYKSPKSKEHHSVESLFSVFRHCLFPLILNSADDAVFFQLWRFHLCCAVLCFACSVRGMQWTLRWGCLCVLPARAAEVRPDEEAESEMLRCADQWKRARMGLEWAQLPAAGLRLHISLSAIQMALSLTWASTALPALPTEERIRPSCPPCLKPRITVVGKHDPQVNQEL